MFPLIEEFDSHVFEKGEVAWVHRTHLCKGEGGLPFVDLLWMELGSLECYTVAALPLFHS